MTKAANLSALGTNTSSSGVLEILSGGTGQTTATAAFNALNPMTTVGDIIYEGAGPSATRLGVGSTNQVLTVISGVPSWQTPASPSAFPAGTAMMFVQTAAPTGWTKSTTHDNKALRVVSGTASSGGSVAFTTAFASQTPAGSVSITTVSGSAGSTTLTTPQIPSHSHPVSTFASGMGGSGQFARSASTYNTAGMRGTNAAGGDGGHTHPFSFTSGSGTFTGTAINLAVQYVDVIIATKD
jgi:hypothetical protein